MKKKIVIPPFFLIIFISNGQSITKSMLRLPDTGETVSYTSTFGEDADFTINPPFFLLNGDGTVTDTVTGLMWQQTDGGEMTVENAIIYCDLLTLGGYTDWRLPNAHEAFSILNHQNANPALDTAVFTKTSAQYWWTSERQANDSTKVWVTNAGGGIGNHPKAETISAGGMKSFHVIAVRNRSTPPIIPNHFTDNGNGTISDNLTNLVWQKIPFADSVTWEQSLTYADTFSIGGFNDWRLPNIKELESLNDESLIGPSVNTSFFSTIGVKKYWSSTTLPNQTTKAWYLDTQYGITTYDFKTAKNNLICVRGNQNNASAINEIFNTRLKPSAFPNPFTSTIRINSKNEYELFELLNCLGQTVYSGGRIELQDFSCLPNGIYFLKIIDKNTTTIKLLKE